MPVKIVSMAVVFLFFMLGGHVLVATWWAKIRGKEMHDPRCISLTDSEFNDRCDCKTLAMIDQKSKEG